MKRLLTLFTLIGAFALIPITRTEARDHGREGRLTGYTPCGKPIYAYHEVVAHDHCGRNVWQWVTRYPSSCHCRDRHRSYHHCDTRYGHYRPSGWSFNIRY